MNFKKWLVLQEGLIPVPRKMMDEAMREIIQELVSYLGELPRP